MGILANNGTHLRPVTNWLQNIRSVRADIHILGEKEKRDSNRKDTVSWQPGDGADFRTASSNKEIRSLGIVGIRVRGLSNRWGK